MRRTIGLTLLVLVLALLALASTVMIASEGGGEIVVLHTRTEAGDWTSTRLWTVDDAGFAWLRAGNTHVGWLTRLEAQPTVEVERGGRRTPFRAVAVRDPAARDRVHALMAEKYGLADRWIGMLRDGAGSIAVRLEPLPPAG